MTDEDVPLEVQVDMVLANYIVNQFNRAANFHINTTEERYMHPKFNDYMDSLETVNWFFYLTGRSSQLEIDSLDFATKDDMDRGYDNPPMYEDDDDMEDM